LDKNGSLLAIKSDLDGVAHVGTLKNAINSSSVTADLFQSLEDYAGDFRIDERVVESGQDISAQRSVSGRGYASEDMRMGSSQRSYSSGTGSFSSVQRIQTLTGFLAKDLNVSYGGTRYRITPYAILNITQKWNEGMWSKTSSSFLGEQFSSADRLQKSATFHSLKDFESEASFSGMSRFRAFYGQNQSRKMDIDQSLIGDFLINRKVLLAGVSRYSEPHLNVTKRGRLQDDVAAYTITIINDGNMALSPVLVNDSFPTGARFLNSTLMPSRRDPNSTIWSLPYLSVGESVRIDINLDVKRCEPNFINWVEAVGNSSAGTVVARNQSIIDRSWLGCCPLEMKDESAGKMGCACQGEAGCQDSEYYDPVQAKMADDSIGACPLSCPEMEAAYEGANKECK
jgi:uncharacterized repeat protein (TIGR01451 family)